ncbi:Protein of unknown function [Cotesia congregata]|uniref:Uncharacterized protein n=1 Tax=Cotesia congregata TaxID=51543 RepID=A0A8J2HJZ6_COTCN|nr:Protein of unknown function [Cotesia congregata]
MKSKTDEKGQNLRTINNNFLKLRKEVKAAKTIVIRKLTKKITAMKEKKSKNPEVEKKIQTLIDQVMDMKKFNSTKQCDKVSLFALKNTLDLQQILSDSKIDSRTKAMGRLVYFKTMKIAVSQFKENNPTYLSWLEQKKEDKAESKKDKKKKDQGKQKEKKKSGDDDNNEDQASKDEKLKKGKNSKKKEPLDEVEDSEAEDSENESENDSEDEVDQESEDDAEDRSLKILKNNDDNNNNVERQAYEAA